MSEVFIRRSQLITAACVASIALSVLILLWFIRAHYLSAVNAGWGDPVQDRQQTLLGWGLRLSAVMAVCSCLAIATRSRRALLSIVIGSVLAVISLPTFWLIAPRFPHIPIIDWIVVFPGTVISLYVFGIHAGRMVPIVYAFIINAAIYSPIASFFFSRRNSSH